jgi:tetratricopeptide (TPR) repeat protein
MANSQADELFAKGLNALSNRHYYLALVCFEQSIQEESTPLCSSYLAFCLAKARGQFAEAIRLCEQTLGNDPENTTHYLNLGRILMLAGQREKALITFRQGLKYGVSDEIVQELNDAGTRKLPPFPSLERRHILNRMCGILLKKIGQR